MWASLPTSGHWGSSRLQGTKRVRYCPGYGSSVGSLQTNPADAAPSHPKMAAFRTSHFMGQRPQSVAVRSSRSLSVHRLPRSSPHAFVQVCIRPVVRSTEPRRQGRAHRVRLHRQTPEPQVRVPPRHPGPRRAGTQLPREVRSPEPGPPVRRRVHPPAGRHRHARRLHRVPEAA